MLTSLPVLQVMASHAILGVRYVLIIQSRVAESDKRATGRITLLIVIAGWDKSLV